MLSLSNCKLGSEFSCDDGSCVPLEFKCDWFSDCSQGEDEVDCKALHLLKNYQKQVNAKKSPNTRNRRITIPNSLKDMIASNNGYQHIIIISRSNFHNDRAIKAKFVGNNKQ